MRVALIAPVGNDRLWSLDHWLGSAHDQTVQADVLCVLTSPGADEVLARLRRQTYFPIVYGSTPVPFVDRNHRNDDPEDRCRADKFARIRNALRRVALSDPADVFISLDTDVLLEDERAVERLLDALYVPSRDGTDRTGKFDVTSLVTYLHILGPKSDCFNAGWWMAGEPGSPERIWRRADRNDVVSHRSPLKIDIPMACYAIRRHALGMCRYKTHEAGEDLGFADSLDRHGMTVGWLTDLEARHVWAPEYL